MSPHNIAHNSPLTGSSFGFEVHSTDCNIYLISRCHPQMIPVFLSIHVSVARSRANFDRLPLYGLTDDVLRGENVGEHYYLPEEDMAENEKKEILDFNTRERSCVESAKLITCAGVKFRIVNCRAVSLTACHNSIPYSGFQKCKTKYEFIPVCGKAYPTECACA